MKIKSNLDLVTNHVQTLQHKKSAVCKINKSIQATKSTVQSKNKPVSLDDDTFSVLTSLQHYLQKDINHFHKIAKEFDSVDKQMKRSIQDRK